MVAAVLLWCATIFSGAAYAGSTTHGPELYYHWSGWGELCMYGTTNYSYPGAFGSGWSAYANSQAWGGSLCFNSAYYNARHVAFAAVYTWSPQHQDYIYYCGDHQADATDHNVTAAVFNPSGGGWPQVCNGATWRAVSYNWEVWWANQWHGDGGLLYGS